MSFCIAFLCMLFCPLFLPKLQLLFFAPYLVRLLYRKNLITTIWNAVVCGIIVDLLAANPHFGYTPLNYAIALLLLYTQRRHFFEEKLVTLPLMVFCFSSATTLCLLAEQPSLFSWRFVTTDLLGMASLDGLFGFFWQTKLYNHKKEIDRMRS